MANLIPGMFRTPVRVPFCAAKKEPKSGPGAPRDPLLIFGSLHYNRRLQLCTDSRIRHALPPPR